MLTLPRSLSLTPAQFAQVCAANPEAVLELAADGTLIEMTPTGGSTGARNTRLVAQLENWAVAADLGWIVFDSSTGFLLPDGSIRSPDASVVRLDRWQALSAAERESFAPICPDLVVELASPSDEIEVLRRKMVAYVTNGARLGWLLLPQKRTVEVWTAGTTESTNSSLVLNDPSRLEAGLEFPGLVIDPRRIWEV
ncbi:MAG: Uma2 family endonuclease [Cyanobacteriota bacterium]